MMYPRHNSTERSQRVLQIAFRIARKLGHEGVSPVHVALGLLGEGKGVAVTALRFHGVDVETVARELRETLPPSPIPLEPSTEPRLTSDGERLLSQARVEARDLGHPYVGTEHLLLALVRDTAGLPGRALARQGLTLADAKARIVWMLTTDPLNPAPFVSPRAV